MLTFEQDENIFVYSPFQSGVMVINAQTLINKSHNQINFYEMDNQISLCEIKPFHALSLYNFCLNKSIIKLVKICDMHVYFNNVYCGKVCGCETVPTFEKISKNDKDYGLIKFDKIKQLIFFDEREILYIGKYLDYEISSKHIQIYDHVPNSFNIGRLTKYCFDTNKIIIKPVNDRDMLITEQNSELVIEYFMEALKCGRYKYAHKKLSSDLRADISEDILKQYFKQFNDYRYINKTNAYITLMNNKVVGVYRFALKQNLIENIY